MKLRNRQSLPKIGEKVWQAERIDRDLQPNGKIVNVLYKDKTVIVHFYEEGETAGKRSKEIEFSDLEGCWTDKFGGCYIIERDG